MAESLNMKFWVKLSYNERFSPVKNNELVRSHTKSGVSSCREYARKYRNRYMQKMICSQLWKKPQINWDGRVLGCCVNHWGDFGNAFESNLNDCLNGDKMNQARQLLLGKMDKRRSILYSAICRAFGKMHFSCIVLLKAALISPKCGGPEGIPCKECSYYKTMQQTGNWLTMEDATNERLIDTPDVLMSLL